MGRSILPFLIPLFIIAGCKSPTSVNDLIVEPGLKDQLKKVNIEQVGYSTVLFENSDSLLISDYDFNTHTVEQIIFGYNLQQLFIPADTITFLYTTSGNSQYILTFRDSVTVPDSLYNLTMVIKYMLRDNDSLIVEKNLSMLSWPYASTSLILNYSYYLTSYCNRIQDFAYTEPVLYYHPYGPCGLYSLDLNTHQAKLLKDYLAGDFIDANSEYIFMDIDHSTIDRYSLAADTVTGELNLQTILGDNVNISGIAAADTLVYVVTNAPDRLLTLNEDLEVLNIRDGLQNYYYSLTYYEGFFYTVDYAGNDSCIIIKINEADLAVILEKGAPVKSIGTVKIYNGRLFFMDDNRKLFCSTELNDIFNSK